MSVHNSQEYLREAVESVLGQTYRGFEFIIIDDASSDDSPAILRSYNDPRIRIIRNSRNLGLTNSLNIGLREARGEWTARLDADDVMLPMRLQTQLEYVERRRCSVCFSRAVLQEEAGGGETLWRESPWPATVWTSLFCNGYGLHPTVMFRRSRVVEVGGYDEAFPKAQDYDLFDRLCGAGEIFGYVTEPLLIYRRHGDRISIRDLDHQEECARRVSFRAIRRYGPDLTDEDAMALRWLFLSREHIPRSIPPNLLELAGRLVRSFLQGPGHRESARWLYQGLILATAHRYREFGTPRLRAGSRRLLWQVSIRTGNWTLPLRWLRQLLRQRARPARADRA